MKKKSVLLAAAVCLTALLLSACAGTEKAAANRQSSGAKVHTYAAGGANAVVVENTKLVIFDSFGGSGADDDFKAFIDSLGKPVDRVFISHGDDHHWIGLDRLFPGVELYSTDAQAIKANPQGAGLPVKDLSDGKVTADGVDYEFITYRDLGAAVIKLPAQKTALVHHLGYAEFHVPLPPLDTRLNILKDLKEEGYTWFIGGHGTPMEAGKFIAQVEEYNSFVKNAVAGQRSPAEAKTAITAQFPGWGGDYLLDIFLPLFYSN